jgi:hypothetical protein
MIIYGFYLPLQAPQFLLNVGSLPKDALKSLQANLAPTKKSDGWLISIFSWLPRGCDHTFHQLGSNNYWTTGIGLC